MACLLHFSQSKRAATTLMYAVLVDDIAQFGELRAKHGTARNEYLMALRNQRRLLLRDKTWRKRLELFRLHPLITRSMIRLSDAHREGGARRIRPDRNRSTR